MLLFLAKTLVSRVIIQYFCAFGAQVETIKKKEMKVLKFGGTSVGTAESIKKVESIVSNEAKEDRVIVVVSAMSQVTNKLLAASDLAANGDESYKEIIKEIEDGATYFQLKLLISEELIRALLSYCGEIEIIEPKELKTALIERISAMHKVYQLN